MSAKIDSMKILIALIAAATAQATYAAPAINSGGPLTTVANGNKYKITGSGFGSGPRELWRADFSGFSDGTAVNGTAADVQTENIYASRTCGADYATPPATEPVYDTAIKRHARVTSSMMGRFRFDNNYSVTYGGPDVTHCWNSHIEAYWGTQEENVFISGWTYIDFNPENDPDVISSGNLSSGNAKLWMLGQTNGGGGNWENYYDPSIYLSWGGGDSSRIAQGGSNVLQFSNNWSANAITMSCPVGSGTTGSAFRRCAEREFYQEDMRGQWVLVEQWVKTQGGSTPNSYDGFTKVIVSENGENFYAENRTPSWQFNDNNDDGSYNIDFGLGFNALNFPFYYSPNRVEDGQECDDLAQGCPSEANWHMGETMITAGAYRVYICPGSTWANRGMCEVQIVSASDSWSNNAITFTLVQGAMSSFSGKYIYVMREEGEYNLVANENGWLFNSSNTQTQQDPVLTISPGPYATGETATLTVTGTDVEPEIYAAETDLELDPVSSGGGTWVFEWSQLNVAPYFLTARVTVDGQQYTSNLVYAQVLPGSVITCDPGDVIFTQQISATKWRATCQ